ncbi:MAG: LOG family protein [Myxococcaceae bacterium]|nr:LOG family protein [Myxococcaceae bacterium]
MPIGLRPVRVSPGSKAVRLKGPVLKDPGLRALLKDLHRDGVTLARALTQWGDAVSVLGSARSKVTPGAQGSADFAFADRLGQKLFEVRESLIDGGSHGTMEAVMRGHARAQAWAYETPGRTKPTTRPNWTGKKSKAAVPKRNGGNIKLPFEQKPNEFLGRLTTFRRFLHRMEFLFRNTTEHIATPGGFGTLAEYFSVIAQKTNRDMNDRLFFGAPDNFFHILNKAFEPFVTGTERGDLSAIHTNVDTLVTAIKTGVRGLGGSKANPYAVVARMRADLEAGLVALDGKPKAFSFVGGNGARSQQAQKGLEALAAELNRGGETVRLGGSPLVDRAVLKGVNRAAPQRDVQAFALGKDTPTTPGTDPIKVNDVLVLRELLISNSKGLVIVPDGALSLAVLFTTLCDLQTRKIPPMPIVVFDPTGEFHQVKAAIKKTMLDPSRNYINPEDLDFFHVTSSPKEAARLLL